MLGGCLDLDLDVDLDADVMSTDCLTTVYVEHPRLFYLHLLIVIMYAYQSVLH